MTVHKQLSDYYQNLFNAQGGVPARSDINPLHLKKILSWVLLAEWHGPKNLVPTVVGSDIDDALGSNFTGVNMFDYYPAEVAEGMQEYYQNILIQPCGGFLVRDVAKKNGAVGTLEALMFPLHDERGLRNRLIGSMFIKNKETAQPNNPDKRTFTSMAITKVEYQDIGLVCP
ncbi:MAG: PAS domain-containing protein [Kordiimonas sp.]